jgi:hypothetical protein
LRELGGLGTFELAEHPQVQEEHLERDVAHTLAYAERRWQKQGWIETTSDGFRLRSTEPLVKLASGEDVEE